MSVHSDSSFDKYDRVSWAALDRKENCSAFATSLGSKVIAGVCKDQLTSTLPNIDNITWYNILVWNIESQRIEKRIRIPFGVLAISSVPCGEEGIYIVSSLRGNSLFLLNSVLGTLKEIVLKPNTNCDLATVTWKLQVVNEGDVASAEDEAKPFISYWTARNLNEAEHSSAFLVLHEALRRPSKTEKHALHTIHQAPDITLYIVGASNNENPATLYQVQLAEKKDCLAQGDDPLEMLSCTVLNTVALDWTYRTLGMAYNYARQEITVISEHKDVAIFSHSTGRLMLTASAAHSRSPCTDVISTNAAAEADTASTELTSTEESESRASPTPSPVTTAPGPIPRLLDYHNSVVYIIHKPLGCLSSAKDYEDAPRGTVYEFAARAGFPHVGLVGRLDGDTSGIMVFTNDGRLNDRILRPPAEPIIPLTTADGGEGTVGIVGATQPASLTAETDRAGTYLALKEKEYLLTLLQGRNKYCMEDGVFNTHQFEEEFGLPLVFNRCNTEYNVREAVIKVVRRFQDPQFNKHDRADQGWVIEVQVNINEGKHKQIRRLAKRAGYHVVGLKRTKICGGLLSVDTIPEPGDCRWLSADEKFALYKGFKLI